MGRFAQNMNELKVIQSGLIEMKLVIVGKDFYKHSSLWTCRDQKPMPTNLYYNYYSVYYCIYHCKNVKVISTLAGFLQWECKGHYNPSWVLSVADISIMAQLANLN